MRKTSLAVVGHIGPAPRGDKMSAPHALAALAALGQPTRLAIFRLLMRREPDGLAAGAIAEAIGCPHNTLSTHLSILARSGLVRGTRDGRSIVYRADVEGMRSADRLSWSTDCCDGHPELCNLAGCAARGAPAARRTEEQPTQEISHAPNACRQEDLQRPVSLHRQFGPLDHGRGHPQSRGRGKLPRLLGRKPARRARCIPTRSISCAS